MSLGDIVAEAHGAINEGLTAARTNAQPALAARPGVGHLTRCG